MGIKDINYKQHLFDYGEKIGLAAAGVIALLLGVWLIVPGSGLFATSASSRADELKKSTEQVSKGLNGNQPDDNDKPPTNIKERLVAFAFDIIPDATIEQQYRVDGLFDGRRGGPGGRQMPTVKQPREADVALVHLQLPGLVYSTDGEYLMILKGVAATTGSGGMNPNSGGTSGGSKMTNPNQGGFNAAGRFGQQAGRQGQKLAGHGLVKNRKDQDPDKAERDYDIGWIKPDDKDVNASTLAMQPAPERVAEIVASFPYKEQIDEFKDRLGLPSEPAVLTEMSAVPEKDPDSGEETPVRSFRFLGVEVQRRSVNSEGLPLDAQGAVVTTPDGGWISLDKDLTEAYATLIVASGGLGKLQPETRFQKVALPGLTLPRLPTVGEQHQPPIDEYPKLEDNLASLKKTVDDLDKTPASAIAKPAFTKKPGDIFHIPLEAGQQTGPGAGGTSGPMGNPNGGMLPTGPKTVGPPAGGTGGAAGSGTDSTPMGGGNAAGKVPDYVLIRLFDFTIEPGKTYEYRIRVRMANPNYGRKDVASQGIAVSKELVESPTDKDWYALPKKLTVSPDLYYYAVDQAKLDAADPPKDKDKDKDTPKLPPQVVKVDTQTVLQIQKWVDYLPTKDRTEVAVGDWVIAERVAATRGEPIGRQRVEVPYWRYQQNRFTMAFDQPPKPNDKKYVASVNVPFTPDGKEPILVDFTGGDVKYARTHPKTDDATPPAAELPIADKAPEEVLLWTADGKLLAHNGAKDATDPDRIKRLDEARAWIDSVKKMKGGKDENKVFGGAGTPAP